MEWRDYLWVGSGGFLGAVARYAVASLAARVAGAGFPYATFVINVSGSMLLGALLTGLAERALPHAHEVRLAAAVGFLGAYTTFSTFEWETHALVAHGRWGAALVNVVGSVVVGFGGLAAGVALARRLG